MKKTEYYYRGIFALVVMSAFFAVIFLFCRKGLAEEIVIAPVNLTAPAIHGPRAVGTTPGRPFIFLIPATGKGPLSFSAKNLPEGLALDAKTGIISGAVAKEGNYSIDLTVAGAEGKSARKLTIVAGKGKLAQTPPMGWNSWNAWGLSVSADKVKAAADAMVSSGLAAHGFQYINIDDGWEKDRDKEGYIRPNEKFPDMKGLSDYVHSKGLRLGIYSSPGPRTCGGFEGSLGHEKQDAEMYAKWGIDYLKYDWCSYREVKKGYDLESYQKPYREMHEYLEATGRDIVYSLCQYGMKDVWKWGPEVGGNLWRTTGDIIDLWFRMAGIGFQQGKIAEFAGPGHWNDPDMLVVGKVGWGPALHNSHLNKTEQLTHITLWSMLAAPLLIGCDMANLDAFTIALLTNDEVLDVDQDPLGKEAIRVASSGKLEVWARPLWDGTKAVALFNRTNKSAEVTVEWKDLGISGSQPVRDLWQHKDLGSFDGSFKAGVAPHGAVMLKIGRPTQGD